VIGAAIWHDEDFKASEIDSEAIVYLKGSVQAGEHVWVNELPAATVASVIHKGAYNTVSQAYEAIGRWIETNGSRWLVPTAKSTWSAPSRCARTMIPT